MSLKLPLPPGFFQCPPLSSEENARYMEIAKQSVQDLVAKARIKDGPVKWTMLSNECDLKVYKGEGHGTTANSDIHCATMETVGHLDEVMRLYRTDTTEQAKEYVQRFSRALVDTITLYTILPRHPDRPNNCIQIKWFVAKSPFDGLVTKRDFCLLESDLEFEVNGKRAWVRAYKSVDLACVPDLRQTLNLIRGYQYDMGHVFIESDRPGYLDMTYLADMDVKGIVPDWANDQAVIQWCRNLSDIDRFLREDRLSGSPFLRPDQLCPLSMRKRCYLCQKRFGPLRKKSNCAKCGEVRASYNHPDPCLTRLDFSFLGTMPQMQQGVAGQSKWHRCNGQVLLSLFAEGVVDSDRRGGRPFEGPPCTECQRRRRRYHSALGPSESPVGRRVDI
ncbi:hypothetical protein, variant [Aphanomyces invadans]|uniref:START domain-containing protein n=1 Tax=Aphanomyces invadans TaxID=157072 RepID=A0A024TIM9_9STRA|nr:hypothetical protein, variant [Aphanomyces invadans]ETV93431.1 hypothetical protein, variant [Aphanomyces invadans]|eukprot:XP_008877773.1 hypothetical protein, variant [Aphanomyces invadans]